ncbi:MAG: cytochrome c maturation protein CcmE [Chloroherpetonaceae bacterium]|nr:cytochrome c maturation protein CcmE [Chthonomonadaceae bacterium]MDW8208390.1 cytochrome c maturation protein CcmE [Chloroherpetonaceae bacterium]
MKQAYIIGLLVIGLALGFTLWAFSSAMTPYVTIAVARQSETPVQVRGKILRDAQHQPHYDRVNNALRFWIEDPKGDRIEVVYKGGKPEAFDEATETAAHGIVRNGIFYSDKLVVKCPSKYEGNSTPYQKESPRGSGTVRDARPTPPYPGGSST